MPDPCKEDALVPSVVAHYKILEKLGEGGMGVVYKAHDTKLDRPVALKFLAPHLRTSEAERARFVQEAKAAAALNHPGICSIIDFHAEPEPGAPEGAPQMFIVMEFVDGRTLRALIEAAPGRRLPLKQALDIGVQVADALAAAHERGVIHRDIKPENIMVRNDGIVQIMDFGLARLRSSLATRVTAPGSTVGTAAYMAPELLEGQDADHRSDIFSLGVLLFELFAGEPPFRGTHAAALTYEIMHVDPPAVSSLRPGAGAHVDRIIAECLRKEKGDRCQSAAEVAKELRRAKSASGAAVSHGTHMASAPEQIVAPRGTPGRRRFLAAGAFVLGALLCACVLLLWRPWGRAVEGSAPAVRFMLTLPGGGTFELRRNGLALSPDGRHLAFIARQDSSVRLFLRDMSSFDAHPVAATAGLNVSGPFFSPDGEWLGFFANGKLMKISLSGGAPVAICDAGVGEASWGDGGEIVFMPTWGSGLAVVRDQPNSTPRPVTKLNLEAGDRAHITPWMLPGSSAALFSIWRGGPLAENEIVSVDLKSGETRTVLKGGSGPRYVAPGSLIYASGSTLMIAPFNVKDRAVAGNPRPVMDSVLMNGGIGFSYFAVSDGGTLVYVQGGVEFVPTAVALVSRGASGRRLEARGYQFGFPWFSPDGKRLSVDIFGPNFQVGVYDLQSGILTPLTFTGDNIDGTWNPDGSALTFYSNVDGRYQLYTIAANGSGTPRKLFDMPGTFQPIFSWRRDGRYLAYTMISEKNGADIWVYSTVDTPATRPLIATAANEANPSYSPDGRWLAYSSDESGATEVYVRAFPGPGGRSRVSQSGGDFPRWSHDGRRIFFLRNDDIVSVPVVPAAGEHAMSFAVGAEERAMTRPGIFSFDVSPVGDMMVVAQQVNRSTWNRIGVVVNWSGELKERF
ncbi:MAG TPA: protein kinase [Bacteroidota bacterium]|nr:protein kinase [Bacteroidota bacterium]